MTPDQKIKLLTDALDHIRKAADGMKHKYRSGYSQFARNRADKALKKVEAQSSEGSVYDVIDKLNAENAKLKQEIEELKR